MLSKFRVTLLGLAAISAGAVYWKYTRMGAARYASQGPKAEQTNPEQTLWESSGKTSKLVRIDDEVITQGDIDFEYQLHTLGIASAGDLTHIPDYGNRYDHELKSLREDLLRGVIERKVLMKYLARDKTFNKNSEADLKQCSQELDALIASKIKLLQTEENRKRLRDRLCERETINRYIRSRVFKTISIGENEIVEYFKNHQNEFQKQARVEIRQILLADEKSARRVRSRTNRYNFAAMAKKHSIAPEAPNGGILGPYRKGELPPVFDIAFKQKPGQVSRIQKSTYGFHIFMVTRKLEKQSIGLKQARKQIRERLARKKQDEVYQKWVEVALHSVQIDSVRPF